MITIIRQSYSIQIGDQSPKPIQSQPLDIHGVYLLEKFHYGSTASYIYVVIINKEFGYVSLIMF